jgi:hypothetical protein
MYVPHHQLKEKLQSPPAADDQIHMLSQRETDQKQQIRRQYRRKPKLC